MANREPQEENEIPVRRRFFSEVAPLAFSNRLPH